MSRAAPVTAAIFGLLALAGCGVQTPANGVWQSVHQSPADAMTTGVAADGGHVYLAYMTASGRLLLQESTQPPMALPGTNLAIAAPGSAETPLAQVAGVLYAGTASGVVPYVPGHGFGAMRQIPNGTPPVSLTSCDGALCFDEIATYDRTSQTEVGPGALARLTPDGKLSVGALPDGVRPLPAPLVAAGGSLWLVAAPEPETRFYLVRASERDLKARIVQRFPSTMKPIALAPDGSAAAVLLLQPSTGRLAIWQGGKETWLTLPSTARAATGAGIVTLAAEPHGGYLLGLPALPGNTSGILHQASLWRIDPKTGAGTRLPMPSAPRRFTAAPVFTAVQGAVIGAWQGHFAYFH